VTLVALATSRAEDPAAWRSRLYGADWTPATTADDGSFLHDFSWAGYRNGDAPIPDVRGPVTEVDADREGKADATEAIQAAIERAGAKGGVVHLKEGLYRIDGTLTVDRPGVVLRGDGAEKTRLLFTKTGLSGGGHLSVAGKLKRSGEWKLAADASARATAVVLESVEGLRPGDDIALGITITDGFRAAYGMERNWKFAAGKWRAFARRTIVAVDAEKKSVRFDIPLRGALETQYGASLQVETGTLRECGIEDLGVCTANDYDAAWTTNLQHAIELRDVADCWVRGVGSFALKRDGVATQGRHLQSGGIRVKNSTRVTVADCAMALPQNRGGGGNGYLFEITQSNEVLTRDCTATSGRHNFIENWDFGTSGCVWLRCTSRGGCSEGIKGLAVVVGFSEYHHSLATACLVDSCTIEDGWKACNRFGESSGAGHCATECVFWNVRGGGLIRSQQFGRGYVIGTAPETRTMTSPDAPGGAGTGPEDAVEGAGLGATLAPSSLYEDQLARRRARGEKAADRR